ncbi:phosphoadenosine phosphosulfate reductase [Lentinula edodes]|uniref:Phosphoadenosine phosphosulfate reductase n=1 Tax=Lentinula edodes TaxID=5353 RepID=A0A1Q3E1E6_LENED|nr:phosphoadenosine phosphosulfate reductase [Lentinula edodes]
MTSIETLSKPLQLPLTPGVLELINAHLSQLQPEQILAWAIEYLPNLYQTTAFGLTGLVAIDMLSKLTTSPPPLIFLDTLYHFRETYELVEEVKLKYRTPLHVYKPAECRTVEDFEAKYGQKLWESDEDTYDFAVKVEPARRAYAELGVQAVITGRRASQAEPTIRVDLPNSGMGYRSVGDWHSTVKVGEGQGERAGRWVGREKTECGLHKDYFTMKKQAMRASAEQDHLPRLCSRPVIIIL